MNKLHRHVLRIRSIRSAPEGQEPPSAKESLRHFAAGFGQSRRFAREETLEHLVAFEQALFNLGRKKVGRKLRCGLHISSSTDRQQIRGSGSPTSISTIRLPP